MASRRKVDLRIRTNVGAQHSCANLQSESFKLYQYICARFSSFLYTDGLWVETVRATCACQKSTFGGARDRQQRAFPKHDIGSAFVFALFAVAVVVAD